MKQLLLFLLAIFFSISLNAQVVNDSVHMGAGYSNEIFYQLNSHSKTSVPFTGVNGWDIGFEVTLMDASIISDPNSISVYLVPNADSNAYATLDTTGYTTWPQQFNSDTSWSKGAFNVRENVLNPFDFGWGVYDINTHTVYGDSLFLIKKGSELYKFWIREKTGTGDYIIRYANLTSGGADMNLTLPAATYPTKNFVYLNLDNPVVLDLEPPSTDWDLLFTHYITVIPFPGPGPYPVTGVQSNFGVTAAKAYPVDTATVSYLNYTGAFSDNLSAIGYDWKTYDMQLNQYVIEDSLIYFVKAKDNSIYSLRFTGFDNTNGDIFFETEQLLTGIDELNGNITQAAVYPNPSNDYTTIVYQSKTVADVKARLFDIAGNEVSNASFKAVQGLNHESLVLPASQGLYHLMLINGDQQINLNVMVLK